MPTPLVGSRRFLLYDYFSVVSRRFYASVMYITSQSPPVISESTHFHRLHQQLKVQIMEPRKQLLAVENGKRVLGPEHPDTLTSMANIASTYRSQGRLEEAEELNVQVMETRKRELGLEHPDTLTSMADLASIVGLDSGMLMQGQPCWSACLNARVPAPSFSSP